MNLFNIKNEKVVKFIFFFSVLFFIIVTPLIGTLIKSNTKEIVVPRDDFYSYEILSGDIITQHIVINESLKEVSLLVSNGARTFDKGTVQISIIQNNIIESQKIDVSSIGEWQYINLDVDYSKFKSGLATIEIKSIDTNAGTSIYFNFLNSTDQSDLSPAKLNGKYVEGPLCISYKEYANSPDSNYRIIILVLIILFMVILCYILANEINSKEYLFFLTAILIGLIASFKYPALTFKAEAWAENATHFYKLASEENVLKNLLSLEGDMYVSLFHVILSLFSVKVLHLSKNYFLFTQLVTLIIFSICYSVFCMKYFKKYFCDFSRVLISVFSATFLSYFQFNTTIAVAYLGIILIICFSLYDFENLSKTEYTTICLITIILCLSKMSYVTLFPSAIIALILFWNKIYIRKIKYFILIAIFSLSEGILSLIIRKYNALHLVGGGTELGNISIIPILELVEKTVYYFIQIVYSVFIRSNNVRYPYMINLFLGLIILFSIGGCCYWIYKKNEYATYGKIIFILYVLAASQCGLSLISNASINSLSNINWNSNVVIYLNGHFMNAYIAIIFIAFIYMYILKDYVCKNGIINSTSKFIICSELIIVTSLTTIYCNYYQDGAINEVTNTNLSFSDWKSYYSNLNNDSYCIAISPAGRFFTKNSEVNFINDNNIMYDEVDISNVGDSSKGVIAIYANKHMYTNQISNKKYVMVMYDNNNNKISEVIQSNGEDREYIGFIPNDPIKNVSKIKFVYEDGKPAYLQNTAYIAREE